MMSDDSENDGVYVEKGHENNVSFKKYKCLLEECESIQKNSERLVYRIEEVKKITKRRLDQIEYIKGKLMSKYGEFWTEIPHKKLRLDEEENKSHVEQFVRVVKEGIKEEVIEEKHLPSTKPVKKPTKRKSGKERDPKAPKRPSNPFFQFCQEQRQVLMEQLAAELKPGEVEPTKQELTRQLAIKWKTLSTLDKQIYVDRYEKSKEKYAAEMFEYKKVI